MTDVSRIGQVGATGIDPDLIKKIELSEAKEDESIFVFTDVKGNETYITIADDTDTENINESDIAALAQAYFGDNTVGLEQREDGLYEVNIVSWGSRKLEGNRYANDCLSRIIANYYPSSDIKLYSDDYKALIDKIMEINGITNPDLIYTGNKVILPIPVFGDKGELLGFIEPDDIQTPEAETPKDPAVTDPAVTDPAVTDPAVTDPAVTDPAVTDAPYPTMEDVTDLEGFITENSAALNAIGVDANTLKYNPELGALTYKNGDQIYTIVKNEDGTWFQTGIKFENGEALEFIAEYDASGKETGEAGFMHKSNRTYTEEGGCSVEFKSFVNDERTENYQKDITEFNNLADDSTPADYAKAVATLANLTTDPSENFDLNDFKTMYAINNGKSFEDYIKENVPDGIDETAILAFLDGIDPMTPYAVLDDNLKSTTDISSNIETILKLSNDDFITLYNTNTELQTYINDASSNATKTLLDYKVSSLGLEGTEGTGGNDDGAGGKTDINNVTTQLMSDETRKTTLNMLGISEEAIGSLTYDENTGIYTSSHGENEAYFTLSEAEDGTWT
ncbi:MAG: hypothetical protein IKU37_05985, partial [Candidatus Gastranaerophilales bacterium]|nr:hypothetical protein [Candidatus Gastranaerophilales bacterium]